MSGIKSSANLQYATANASYATDKELFWNGSEYTSWTISILGEDNK